jgi:two-component system sensor histidine kinase AlgZ
MRHNRLNVGAVPEPGKEFFLPELCLPQALLVLAELIVMVLVWVEPMRPAFGWRACDPVKAE